MSNYVAVMELLEQTCDIFLHEYMDYSLWRYILQRMSPLVSAFRDANLEEAVAIALNTIKLRSGHAMESIWSYHKPAQDGQLRSRPFSMQLAEIVVDEPQTEPMG
jgi:hypothetical protein